MCFRNKNSSVRFSSTSEMLTILLVAIASISLIVSGIGIMNIMYVSVKERTKEIGLRMAIGAKGKDILAQFLIESVLISITGGGIRGNYWLISHCRRIAVYRLASEYHLVFYCNILFGMYYYRGILWLVSCPQSSRVRAY